MKEIDQRRDAQSGGYEYRTVWADGDVTWVRGSAFLDPDGTFTRQFLQKAKKADIIAALDPKDVNELRVMCGHLKLKVQAQSICLSYVQLTGTKDVLLHTLAKHFLEYRNNPLKWNEDRLQMLVGAPSGGEGSNVRLIRDYYSTNSRSLDEFDQLWYSVQYEIRNAHWKTCYAWALVVDAVINARTAFCELHKEKIPLKDFVRRMCDEILFQGV